MAETRLRVLTPEAGDARYASGNALATGISTLPRTDVTSTALVLGVSGSLRLTYFTPSKTATATQIRVLTGGSPAAATPSLIRFGIYSVSAGGDLTLAGSTANDTSLLAAANTAYTKALQVPTTLDRSARYAFGILIVSSAALPTMPGQSLAIAPSEAAMNPSLAAQVGGQSDLPAAVPVGTVQFNTAQRFYGALLP